MAYLIPTTRILQRKTSFVTPLRSFFIVIVTESYEILGDPLRRKVYRIIPQLLELWSQVDVEGTGSLKDLDALGDESTSSDGGAHVKAELALLSIIKGLDQRAREIFTPNSRTQLFTEKQAAIQCKAVREHYI